MVFQDVKASLITIIGTAAALLPAARQFLTIGYQGQSKGKYKDEFTSVQVYYQNGRFDKAQRITGPVNHYLTFKLDFTVARKAAADLDVLNDANATPAERAAALADMEEAADIADEALDQLYADVFQIVMAGQNYDIGQDIGTVSDRMIENFNKDDPLPRGGLVVLTGSANFTCQVSETVPGEIPSGGTKEILTDNNITLDADEDTIPGGSVEKQTA